MAGHIKKPIAMRFQKKNLKNATRAPKNKWKCWRTLFFSG